MQSKIINFSVYYIYYCMIYEDGWECFEEVDARIQGYSSVLMLPWQLLHSIRTDPQSSGRYRCRSEKWRQFLWMGSIDYVCVSHVIVTWSLPFRGPEDSSFEGGVFVTELVFPQDYPLSPPKMKFISDMFHPNGNRPHPFWPHPYAVLLVYPDGRVCISILHTPGDDPLGYETAAERWSPVQSIEKILLSVVSMLAGK